MSKLTFLGKTLPIKRKLKEMAANPVGLLCFWLVLSTYAFYPFYKFYKFNTNKNTGK